MRTFLKLHYDLLRNPEYRAFMLTPANIVYTLILSHVFRANWKYPRNYDNHPLIGFYNEGWLAARVSTRGLHKEFPERSVRAIAADLHHLEEMELIDTYVFPDDGSTLCQIGSWTIYEHPNGRQQYAEIWYIDRVFGPELSPAQDLPGG